MQILNVKLDLFPTIGLLQQLLPNATTPSLAHKQCFFSFLLPLTILLNFSTKLSSLILMSWKWWKKRANEYDCSQALSWQVSATNFHILDLLLFLLRIFYLKCYTFCYHLVLDENKMSSKYILIENESTIILHFYLTYLMCTT